MTLRLACLLAPGPKTVEHGRLAEALGFDRVWLADSPALWQDIWARMALVAAQTHRVQLGTAVLIPSLRHVVTQAAAIATIADIAPGRLTVGAERMAYSVGLIPLHGSIFVGRRSPGASASGSRYGTSKCGVS